MNSRKPQKFAEPGIRMCLLIMLIFALVTFFFARFNRYIAYGEAIVTALGVGLGFTVALMLYSRLRDAVYDEEAIPAAFRGLPVSLLTAGMIVLALMALNF